MDLQQQYLSLAYTVLPPSMLDWFNVVDVKMEYIKATGKEIFNGTIDIYLDERDNRDNAQMEDLRPNGFTEPTVVNDFPIRDKKVKLHIRRRRWLNSDGRNVLICGYPLAADGTRISPEFAAFLKVCNGNASGDGQIDWFELGC
jgi:hypothetical protein